MYQSALDKLVCGHATNMCICIFKLDKQQDKQFQDFFDDLMIFGRIPLSEINYPTPLPDDRKSR